VHRTVTGALCGSITGMLAKGIALQSRPMWRQLEHMPPFGTCVGSTGAPVSAHTLMPSRSIHCRIVCRSMS
jgi:hypothetical protein